MRDLKFDPLTTYVGPVLAPIEMERFTGLEDQRHIGAASRCLFSTVLILAPGPGKSRDAFIGAIISQLHQIRVHLFDRAPLFARLAGVDQKPSGQPIRIWVQFAWTLGRLELRLLRAFA